MIRQLHGTTWVTIAILLALAASRQEGGGATYRNPVIEGDLADPAVIFHEGTYYLYATRALPTRSLL